MDGFDGKMKQAEDRFVERMNKGMPLVMDKYINRKFEELRRQTGKEAVSGDTHGSYTLGSGVCLCRGASFSLPRLTSMTPSPRCPIGLESLSLVSATTEKV